MNNADAVRIVAPLGRLTALRLVIDERVLDAMLTLAACWIYLDAIRRGFRHHGWRSHQPLRARRVRTGGPALHPVDEQPVFPAAA